MLKDQQFKLKAYIYIYILGRQANIYIYILFIILPFVSVYEKCAKMKNDLFAYPQNAVNV